MNARMGNDDVHRNRSKDTEARNEKNENSKMEAEKIREGLSSVPDGDLQMGRQSRNKSTDLTDEVSSPPRKRKSLWDRNSRTNENALENSPLSPIADVNENLLQYHFNDLVVATAGVSRQFYLTGAFFALFTQNKDRLKFDSLLDTLLQLVFDEMKIEQEVKNFCSILLFIPIFFIFQFVFHISLKIENVVPFFYLLLLSPVLKSLVASWDVDTVHLTSSILLMLHLVSFSYGKMNKVSIFSSNCAIFAAVLLISGDSVHFSNIDVFYQISFFVIWFQFLPPFLKNITFYQNIFTNIAFIFLNYVFGVSILILFFSMLIFCASPFLFQILHQKLKYSIEGPWDIHHVSSQGNTSMLTTPIRKDASSSPLNPVCSPRNIVTPPKLFDLVTRSKSKGDENKNSGTKSEE